MFSIVLIITYTLFSAVSSAKILGIVPTPSFSHQIAFWPLWKELSLRGHEVTVVTTDPMPQEPSLKTLTHIDVSVAYDVLKKNKWEEYATEIKDDPMKIWLFYLKIGEELHDRMFETAGLQNLIHNRSIEFDLVMIEYLNPVFFAFQHRFNAPFVGISSLDVTFTGHDCLGNPTHPVLYPDVYFPLTGEMNFFQRVLSSLSSIFTRRFFAQINSEIDEGLVKYFGEGYPKIEEIACRVDLLLMNVNPIFNTVRPTVPAVIHVGAGMHIQKTKDLPTDLQFYLDSAEEGVIYFSLGTNVQSKLIPDDKKKIILETFSELPYKVLWKFENDSLPGKPENVKIARWYPQQDVLRHPNMKLFITQGGIQSLEEALFSHVPMIGIPFFGDQYSNVNKMVQKGLGLKLNLDDLTKKSFKSAMLEVIRNPRYKNKVVEIATLSLDQPMTGLEKAVWWTEYVLRHKGAQHLKGLAGKLPAYQYYLLDVIGFLLMCLGVVVFLALKIWGCCKRQIKEKFKSE